MLSLQSKKTKGMLDFLNIGFVDVLDILLVAVIIFYVLKLLKGSQAMSIFLAILVLYALRVTASALNMQLTSSLLGTVMDVGLIALIVIFQPEIRRFLSTIGNSYKQAGETSKFLSRFLGRNKKGVESSTTINEICKACAEMSHEMCGALIVMQRSNPLRYYIETGDMIDAVVSKRLLMNLFFKNSPLHDGAVIISGDRVVAARCTLPITERDVPASFGMRHKAAVGISENTDALVIVVSEQTGRITAVSQGQATHIENINDLKLLLQNG